MAFSMRRSLVSAARWASNRQQLVLPSQRSCRTRHSAGRVVMRSTSSGLGRLSSDEAGNCAAPGARREQLGRWASFCSEWNELLGRRPLAVVVFFNATCTMTWAILFGTLSSSAWAQTLLAAPDYAVGWFVMRATVKIRQPLNLALAAVLSRFIPALSLLKVSPLLAFVTGDAETRRSMNSARRALFRKLGNAQRRAKLRHFLRSSAKGWSWLEGPIDRYGLSYFVSSKFTNVSVLCAATAASMHGLDVTGTLTSWGFSNDLQKDAGLFASAAALNVPLMPLHFYGSTAAVRGLERSAAKAWQVHLQDPLPGSQDLGEDEPLTEEEFAKNLVSRVALLVVSLDLAVALYIMRRMAKSQAGEKSATVSAGDDCAEADSGSDVSHTASK